MAILFNRLKVAQVRRETLEAVSVAFAVPPGLADDYRFESGQHLTLRATLGGVEERRSYSICCGRDEGELRIAVKKVEGGLFSSFVNGELRAGDEIEVMTPQGRFGVPSDPARSRSYLAVAAGSGITPIMSILKTALVREPRSRFMLLYGNRTSQSILFKEELEDLKDRYLDRLTVIHALSRERQELDLLNGRIDAAKIEAVVGMIGAADAVDHVFLCGPGGLIEEGRATLERLGLAAERIHVEYFTAEGEVRPRRRAAASSAVASAEALAIVAITLDGASYDVPMLEGEHVVDAGLRAGLDMPYSCRGGMCCTCRAKLVEGEVAMDLNYSLEPWEIEAGFVLTCQSRPLTARIAVDYDQL